MNDQFLIDLLNQISVSGREEPVQDVVKRHMKEYADCILDDAMGNVICVLNPESPRKIMLSAHADEIGLVISHITENGRLQVIERGAIIPSTYPGQQVQILTAQGMIYGVVEGRRGTFAKQDLSAVDFLIDIGAKSREEALEKVELGNPIVVDTQIRQLLNGRFTARALDDRLGVYIIMEALKRVREQSGGQNSEQNGGQNREKAYIKERAETRCTAGIYAASTIGEETTKTGAYWTSSRIQPDIAVVVDVTYCSDYSGMNPAEAGEIELGKGPVLCDSPITAKRLNQKMKECAARIGVPLQMEMTSRLTHTDGDQIHFSNQGVPTVFVSIPLRYMHTPAEVADAMDVENCIKLITEFILKWDAHPA